MKALFHLTVIIWSLSSALAAPHFQAGRLGCARNIRPNDCFDKTGRTKGVCMFAWDCHNTNGTHLGTCVDRFYFGSCCKHKHKHSTPHLEVSNSIEATINVVLPEPVNLHSSSDQLNDNGGSPIAEEENSISQNVETLNEEIIPVEMLNEELSPVIILNEEIFPAEIFNEENTHVEILNEDIIPMETVIEEYIPIEILNEENTHVEILNEETIPVEISNAVNTPVEILNEEDTHIEILNEENPPEDILNEETMPVEIIIEEKTPMEILSEVNTPLEIINEEISAEENLNEEISNAVVLTEDIIPVDIIPANHINEEFIPVDSLVDVSTPVESFNKENTNEENKDTTGPDTEILIQNEVEETGGGHQVIYFPEPITEIEKIDVDQQPNDEQIIEISNIAILDQADNEEPNGDSNMNQQISHDAPMTTEKVPENNLNHVPFIIVESEPIPSQEQNPILIDNYFVPDRIPEENTANVETIEIPDSPKEKPIIFLDSSTGQIKFPTNEFDDTEEQTVNNEIATTEIISEIGFDNVGEGEVIDEQGDENIPLDTKSNADNEMQTTSDNKENNDMVEQDATVVKEIENVINIILNQQDLDDLDVSTGIIKTTLPSVEDNDMTESSQDTDAMSTVTEMTVNIDDIQSQLDIDPAKPDGGSLTPDNSDIQVVPGILVLTTSNTVTEKEEEDIPSTEHPIKIHEVPDTEEGTTEATATSYIDDPNHQSLEVAVFSSVDEKPEEVATSSNMNQIPIEGNGQSNNIEEQSIESPTTLVSVQEQPVEVIPSTIHEHTVQTGTENNNDQPVQPLQTINEQTNHSTTISSITDKFVEVTTEVGIIESVVPITSQTVKIYPPTTSPNQESFSNESKPVTPEEQEKILLENLRTANYKDVCGTPVYPVSRIVGGNEATYGEWPWQVSLRQRRNVAFLHKCGATLVNENWVITAAHCVEGIEPEELLVVIGEYDLGTTNEPYGHVERGVQVIAMHPKFEPRTFEYDLALLRMPEPIIFQPNIIPICIPGDDYNFLGETGFVTGWGRLYEDGPLPTVMQKVPVPVIPNKNCEGMYRNAGYIEHIPDIFICAGYQLGKQDSCEGDSGGPLVINYKNRWNLAGIISWGIGCAVPNQPGVYTRISEFREWINKIIVF